MLRVIVTFLALLVALPAAAQTSGTLQKIKDTGVFTIGYRESSPRMSYVTADGKPAGYSVELCQEVAAAAARQLGMPNLDVRYVKVTPADRIQRVVDGTIDIECGTTTHTLNRQKEVDFSNSIFITGASLLSKSSSAIAGLSAVAGKKLAVIPETTTATVLMEKTASLSPAPKIITVKDHQEGLEAVNSGKADAYVSDQLILIGLVLTSPDPKKYAIAEEIFSFEPYGLMMRRGDADFRLLVDSTLADVYRSGKIATIFSRWFGDWNARPSNLLAAMYILNALPVD